MPVSLDQVMNQEAKTDLKVGEETLEITYNPSNWTPEFESTLKVSDDNPFASVLYARMVSKIVTRWDLMEASGKPVKLTEERLSKLPVRFLADVVGALTEHMSPKKKPSANSGSFS